MAMVEVVKRTIYALSIPKYIFVQIQGVALPAQIEADKIEREGDEYLLKLGNVQVGLFKYGVVQGWWITDTGK